MFHLAFRLVDRSDVAATQPVLERAGWRCERCGNGDNLRVIDQRGALSVACDTCRVKIGQPVSVGTKKPKAIEALIAQSSLGAPEVVALRRSVDPALVDRVLQRASELEALKKLAEDAQEYDLGYGAEPESAVIKVR